MDKLYTKEIRFFLQTILLHSTFYSCNSYERGEVWGEGLYVVLLIYKNKWVDKQGQSCTYVCINPFSWTNKSCCASRC